MHSLLVTMVAGLVFASALAAAAADPLVGTWKLNLARSNFAAGMAPKSGTVRNDAQENGIKSLFEGLGANGKPFHLEYSGKYDGKDYPIAGGATLETMACTRIDARTIDLVQKKAGKVIAGGRILISKDGKTATVAAKVKNAKGQESAIIEVFDKQ